MCCRRRCTSASPRAAMPTSPTSCSRRCATSSAATGKEGIEARIMIHPSGALVLFGATGDLAHKKTFASLQAMVKRGHLNVPVIGVARNEWNLEKLQARARDGIEKFGGGVDEPAFGKLMQLLRYVEGDYQDPTTYDRLREALGDAKRPLLLPGDSAEHVPDRGQGPGPREADDPGAGRGREAVRPRPRLGARPQSPAARCLRGVRDLPDRPLPRQGAGPEPHVFPLRQLDARADLEPQLRQQHPAYDRRGFRGGGPRPVLRGGGRPARRGAEPRPADHRVSDHGAAERLRRRIAARREGQAPEGDPPAHAAQRRARPVPGIPQGGRRGAGLRRSRPSPRCACTSIPGAGRTCRC